jgi:hypothetical protein
VQAAEFEDVIMILLAFDGLLMWTQKQTALVEFLQNIASAGEMMLTDGVGDEVKELLRLSDDLKE